MVCFSSVLYSTIAARFCKSSRVSLPCRKCEVHTFMLQRFELEVRRIAAGYKCSNHKVVPIWTVPTLTPAAAKAAKFHHWQVTLYTSRRFERLGGSWSQRTHVCLPVQGSNSGHHHRHGGGRTHTAGIILRQYGNDINVYFAKISNTVGLYHQENL